jgi:hypothetical protein
MVTAQLYQHEHVYHERIACRCLLQNLLQNSIESIAYSTHDHWISCRMQSFDVSISLLPKIMPVKNKKIPVAKDE